MSVNLAFEAFKAQYLPNWEKNAGVTQEQVGRLQQMVDEGLITEADFKLSPLVLFSLAGLPPRSGMGSFNPENGLTALREKLITPMKLQELYNVRLKPHGTASGDLALSEEGLALMRQGLDLKEILEKDVEDLSVVADQVFGLTADIFKSSH